MEGSSKMAGDPVSKMIDLAVFYMKKDVTDEHITSKINSLGFKIASFNKTDMVVTIQHPSSSLMKKFFDIVSNSETSQNMYLHQDLPIHSISNTDASVDSDVKMRSDEDYRPNGKTVDRNGNAKGIANSFVSDEKQKLDIDSLRSNAVRRKQDDLEYHNTLKDTTQREHKPKIGNARGKSYEMETVCLSKPLDHCLGLKTELRSDSSLSFDMETVNSSSNPDIKVKNNVEVVTMREERTFSSLSALDNKDKVKGVCGRACLKSEDKLTNDAEHENSDEIKKPIELVFQKRSQRFPDSQNVDTSNTTVGKVMSENSEKSHDSRFQSQAKTCNRLTDKIGMSRKSSSSYQLDIRHDQNKEKIIPSENPTGTSYNNALKLQKNMIDDDNKAESCYEMISLTETVFRKVSQRYPGYIGYYSAMVLTNGEMSYSVNIKKSQGFDELLRYVADCDSKATILGSLTRANGSTQSLQSSSAISSEKSLISKTHQFDPSDIDQVFEKKLDNLLFQVQIKDITCLSVDVIVCPASKSLDLHSGLPKATSDVAGRVLKRACEEFITNFGALDVTDVFISPAGNLLAKEVFHAVGPCFDVARINLTPALFAKDLTKTLLTCLMLADVRGFKSIAFPFISASTSESLSDDYFGCFSNYLSAVMSFDNFRLSNKNYTQTLQTVIFVDKDTLKTEKFIKFLNLKWDTHAAQCTTTTSSASLHLYNSDILTTVLLDESCKSRNRWTKKGVAGSISKLRDINSPLHSESIATRTSPPLCTICYEGDVVVTLSCCNKKTCQSCKDKIMRCPFCMYIFDVLKGNQPDGSMVVKKIAPYLPGFEGIQTYEITYYLSSGIQGKDHPNPGTMYHPAKRIAYIPKTREKSFLICRLALAFWRRLTFTISTSLTTGKDNSIVWNGIHHKTSLKYSREGFSFPDPGYLSRLDDELNERAVTIKSMNQEERQLLHAFKKSLEEKNQGCITVGPMYHY